MNRLLSAVTIGAMFVALAFTQGLADRHRRRFDMTAEGFYTLSDVTLRLLSRLSIDVEIMLFIRADDPVRTDAEALLVELASHSSRVRYRVVDVELEPELVRRFRVTRNRVAVFVGGGRSVQSRGCDEIHLLSGLRRLVDTTGKRVLFLYGHNERDVLSPDRDGVRMFAEALVAAGLRVDPVRLVDHPLPIDCGTLVIVDPQVDLLEDEIRKLRELVNRGGGILVALDRIPGPRLAAFLRDWGLCLGEGTVVDPRLNKQNSPKHVIVTGFRPHPAVRTLSAVVLHGAKPVYFLRKRGFEYEQLVLSNKSSWVESSDSISFDPGVDRPGPNPVAVAVKHALAGHAPDEEHSGRLILFGDGDVLSNAALRDLDNAELGLGMIEWLAGYGEKAVLLPKQFLARRFYLTPGQFKVVFVFSVILVPLVTAFAGVTIRWVRR